MIKKIILCGPIIKLSKNAYGGGVGGYTRNMKVYLDTYENDTFKQIPCFHSVRGQFKYESFVFRIIYDMLIFLKCLIVEKPKAVHILAQYRTAIPREFIFILFSKMLRKSILYEIKAGAFISWYKSTNIIFRKMTNFCIEQSDLILVEGIPYISFIRDKWNKTAYYFPNFVPENEVPIRANQLLLNNKVRILFVGYCYKGKGIFELVEACEKIKIEEQIELTIIGHEHRDFKEFMNSRTPNENLIIKRLGRRPHRDVLSCFQNTDIYCYPTSHSGEGHNNTINEAMMNGCIILTTKQGFLATVISEERGYFLEDISIACLKQTLEDIIKNKDISTQKAINARMHLIEHFTSTKAYEKLNNFYDKIIN